MATVARGNIVAEYACVTMVTLRHITVYLITKPNKAALVNKSKVAF